MLGRAALLRRAAASASKFSAPRRMLAEEAVAVDSNKLKLNFFLPHISIKHNAEVVSQPAMALIATTFDKTDTR